ncbi:MAG TPA: serine hydrolase domain-containing protein [Candidatus Acidoferrales bacterium]|jgi:D-alanyl-D-alanine carboxypeptidase|nr:serine hydrolase domain-containing protein [Candidatus Acidoferrales bacterium]
MRNHKKFLPLFFLLLAAAFAETARPDIDNVANEALTATGVPSASVSIVENGKISYAKAYGKARLDPATPAESQMRYAIGSISKQFTATAILMLQEEGKLTLDDHVDKYVPGLTRGNEVTIRELLSHTSGYQDFWPQDYVPPMMLEPVSVQKILDLWARKPLDFDPGTKWQYSNTNYAIAGLIVEKVSGTPFFDFIQNRIFKPLGMHSVADVNLSKLNTTDATGYFRYALGPPRVAPKEGKGWLFAMGELAMTAEDLQKWNISIINETLLKPASYKELETEVLLKDGSPTGYALGISVARRNGHRVLQHGGEVSGFTATSMILPDDHVAIVVLTNQDAAEASGLIARGIADKLLQSKSDPKQDALVEQVLRDLAKGKIERGLFTDNANAYFDDQALHDYAASLGPLGKPVAVSQSGTSLRGGMTYRSYTAKYAKKALTLSIFEMPDGKIEQFIIRPQE